MKAVGCDAKVYLWQGIVDMRMGCYRLNQLVLESLGLAITAGGYFVFLSRNRSRVKILYWDRDGYAMWQKGLEVGSFKVRKEEAVEIITELDLEEILSGIEFSRIKFRKSQINMVA
jgi:transposase